MNTLKDLSPLTSVAVVGPMRSGKSATLLRWIHEFQKMGLKVVAIKPALDTRDMGAIVSREKHLPLNHFPAYTVETTKQIINFFEKQLKEGKMMPDVVVIDEAMLFDEGLVMVRDYLTTMGCQVRIAGLDTDYRGETFQLAWRQNQQDDEGVYRMPTTMKDVLSDYDLVVQQTAVCEHTGCDLPASMTQKLVNGRPAPWSSEVIDVGDAQYEARCSGHHIVPKKPDKQPHKVPGEIFLQPEGQGKSRRQERREKRHHSRSR